MTKIVFSTNILLYLGSHTDRASYYGMPIGKHMRSIEWCYFQLS